MLLHGFTHVSVIAIGGISRHVSLTHRTNERKILWGMYVILYKFSIGTQGKSVQLFAIVVHDTSSFRCPSRKFEGWNDLMI